MPSSQVTSPAQTLYIGYGPRARALFIDSIWWTVLMVFIPVGPSTDEILLAPDQYGMSIVFWLLVLQCVPIVITGMMWAVWGTTPGKRLLHLKIVDADTLAPMSRRQVALRTLGYLICFALCGAGFLWVLFTPRKQGLHDRIANTVVIDERNLRSSQQADAVRSRD